MSTSIVVARRTLAVSSGMLRQPSRPTSAPSALTIRGLTSTSRPFDAASPSCGPLTSTTTIRTISPSCVAASPTQCPNESIVSIEIRRHARDLLGLVRPCPRHLLERGVRVDGGPRGRALHDVGLERADRHVDALLGAHLVEHRAQRLRAMPAGSATSSTIA